MTRLGAGSFANWAGTPGLLEAGPLEERQLTHSAKNHDMDNNDNFSPDGRLLCYDTREMLGAGIGNGTTIEVLDLETGEEIVVYTPEHFVTGERPAPGVGACSFAGDSNRIVFIHGPLLAEVPERGPYAIPNRNGMEVLADGARAFHWMDHRDAATDRDTLPGAHRGGTHRHEYTVDGKRVGFTYNDFLLTQYDRTVGYMEAHAKAPGGASHYFVILVPVALIGASKPGEIEKAAGDSWVGRHGAMRAFIGKVRNDDGETYEESLFVVDVPLDTDITTADSGSATRFPTPPKGTAIRRLTHTWAGGIVRGTLEGDRIAYLGHAEDGSTQIFVIASDGSDRAEDPAKRPRQVTSIPQGVDNSIRWHPSGNTIFCVADNAIVATCVEDGPNFGKSVFLTPRGDAPARLKMALSPDATRIVYNRPIPSYDAEGSRVILHDGTDPLQIYMVSLEG
ncbi:MAG: DUF3748 domain-containing protein [Candidatus Hydrogenedentes bacterium]|nr:DUF3748 domain-containing protein [Candidatus Hydrogenedentota bacterium]